MVTLHCTKRAREFLGVSFSDTATNSNESPTQWFAHVVRVGAHNCLLFTHRDSLYSFWVAPFRKAMVPNLLPLFRQRLRETLGRDGFNQHAERYLVGHDGFTFVPASDRSTLASVNVHVLDSRAYFAHGGGAATADIAEISHRLNHTPKKSTRFGDAFAYPVEILAQLMNAAEPDQLTDS